MSDVAETAADCEFVAVTENDPEHVTTVTIDRPDARNALHGPLREELKAVFAAVDESDARVVVLTGSDDAGAFVAGADVSELRERNAVEQRRASERPRVYETVEDVRQPVIARLNGHALGGGLELALACDVRIATPNATFAETGVRLGLFGAWGGTVRLPRVVGEGNAMDLALSGRTIDAAEALRMGLVSRVVDDPAGVAHEVAANDTRALDRLQPLLRHRGTAVDRERAEREAFADLVARNAEALGN